MFCLSFEWGQSLILLRNLIGIIGLLFVGLGFYALAAGLMEWSDGLAFSFHAIDTVFADVFGDGYTNNTPGNIRGALTQLPAFFVLSLTGIFMAWLGFRPQKPKPKFRR